MEALRSALDPERFLHERYRFVNQSVDLLAVTSAEQGAVVP